MNALRMDVNGLIEANRSYAHAIAGEVLRKLSTSADRDEVRAAAELGLVEAAQVFDGARGISFKTFAYYRIRGAIYDFLRKTLGRGEQARLHFEAAADQYLADVAEAPATGPASASFERLKEVAGTVMTCYLVSLDQMQTEVVDQNAESPEQIFGRKENRERVRAAISALPEKNRSLIEGYYFGELSLEEIGKSMGLSKSWVCRLHAKSLEMLRDRLTTGQNRQATLAQAAR